MSDAPILVPLDGSTLAESALPHAATLARATSRTLALLSVLETLPHPLLLPGTTEMRERLQKALRHERQRYLEQLAGALARRGLPATAHFVDGEPVDEILGAAARLDAGLTVMATHGRGGVHRWLIGSVADKVMRASTRPVLLVPAVEEGAGTPEVALTRILVPVDGSDLSETALKPAAELARAAGAQIALVRVEPWATARMFLPAEYIPDLTETDKAIAADAEAYLERVRNQLPDTPPVENAVLRGPAGPTLVAFAHEAPLGLIVMATHGRGGVRRLALGSVADRLVREGLPVLLIPPAAAEPDSRPGGLV